MDTRSRPVQVHAMIMKTSQTPNEPEMTANLIRNFLASKYCITSKGIYYYYTETHTLVALIITSIYFPSSIDFDYTYAEAASM